MRIIYVTSLMLLHFVGFAQTDNDTLQKNLQIQEVVISGIRANEKMPVTQITLKQKQIEERYYGADIPTLLNSTPSINSYSDNGTGIGYSFFRLRGLDQSRINFTINGMPVNDPESQGTFFNNYADLASSAGSIQIQRGVGTSSNGTASFAGSVNLTTKALSMLPQFTINAGMGSFNSRRVSAEYQTGLLANKFAFSGRISDVATDGYRDRSGSHINSMFLSGAYFGKKSVLKFNILSGKAQSKLAYVGIDKITLEKSRTNNSFVNNEIDGFNQNFYQLQYSYQLSPFAGLSVSGYYITGNAPKFQYFLDGSYNTYSFMNMPNAIVGTDTLQYTDAIASYRLNQRFYGGFANYSYKKGKVDLNIGVHANAFISEHFMEINWARVLPAGVSQDHQAYFNTGYKNEVSAFAKLNYSFTEKWIGFADLQLRYATFKYRGKDMAIHRDTFPVEDMVWSFLNPRVGMRFVANEKLSFYALFGITTREPTRIDYLADEYPSEPIKQDKIKPESVTDFELGANYSGKRLGFQANLFYMDFTNQLVNTGKLNNVGYSVTANVDKSYRAGLEIDLTWKALDWLWLMNTTSLMKNEIKSYTQYYDSAGAYTTSVGVEFNNASAALTPDLIMNNAIRLIPSKWSYLEVLYRTVSRQFLDNTSDPNLSIPNFAVLDARVGVSLQKWIKAGEPSIAFQANNLLNSLYTPNGNTSGYTMNYDANGKASRGANALFFPAATRNYFVTVTWKF
jgi:iron complex outermembrane receptor protein